MTVLNLVAAEPTLTVTKVVNNDDGGTAVVRDFTLRIDGNPVTSGAVNEVTAGAHVVSEDPVVGYTSVIGGDCDAAGNVTVAAGEDKTCTITNDDIGPETPTLTVTKVVTNDDGGTAAVGDFTLRIDGNPVPSDAVNEVTAGAHVVSEDPVAGYISVIGGDCDAAGNVTLAAGEKKTCTITNDDIAPEIPTLTVTKVVTNDDGGTAVVGDFTLLIDGNPVTSGDSNQVTVGSHTVSEDPFTGYTSVIGGDCDAAGNVTLAAGEDKTCTITNDDIPGPDIPTLTVTKVVINDDGGTAVVGDFTLLIDGNPVTSGDSNQVTVGSHTVSEDPFTGYTSVIGGDCAPDGSVTVAAGEDKTCTITNDDGEVEPDVTPPDGLEAGDLTCTSVLSHLESAGAVTVTCTLSPDAPGPVTVEITVGSTDTDGLDFTISPNSLTFNPGESHTININILEDDLVEGIEVIEITLTAGDTVLATHFLTIVDNEPVSGGTGGTGGVVGPTGGGGGGGGCGVRRPPRPVFGSGTTSTPLPPLPTAVPTAPTAVPPAATATTEPAPTAEPPATATPLPPSTDTPEPVVEAAVEEPVPTPVGVPLEEPPAGGFPAWGWLLIGLAVAALVLGGGGALFLRYRRGTT